jgi:hypothetical protein
MSALRVYRDDGPLAQSVARASTAVRLPVGPLVLTVAGAVPLLAALVIWHDELPPAGAGLLAVALLVAAAGAAAPRSDRGRLGWLVPPLLRVLEYGVVLRIVAVSEPRALPACYALLGALAFHHYDSVYRLRHQKAEPPTWLRFSSGGWDGRLLVVFAFAAAGALRPTLIILAIVLGVLFVAESVVSWLRFARLEARSVYEDDDVEAE